MTQSHNGAHHRLEMRTTLFAFLALALVSCDSADNPFEVQLDEQFQLKYGQTATLRGNSLSLKFSGVPEDSRCPIDVMCFWEGNAKVALELSGTKLYLNTTLEPKEINHWGVKIVLKAVRPLRMHRKEINLRDYTITLLVTKQ
jgi:hypothetical protein